jgi:hypothetical protein
MWCVAVNNHRAFILFMVEVMLAQCLFIRASTNCKFCLLFVFWLLIAFLMQLLLIPNQRFQKWFIWKDKGIRWDFSNTPLIIVNLFERYCHCTMTARMLWVPSTLCWLPDFKPWETGQKPDGRWCCIKLFFDANINKDNIMYHIWNTTYRTNGIFFKINGCIKIGVNCSPILYT